MKTLESHIGILGLGNRTTLFYLESLNNIYHSQLGDFHTFPCLVYNVDFNSINPYLPNQFDVLIPTLQTHLDSFNKLPVKSILIPNITLHEAFDRCNSLHNSIHPLELTVSYIKSNAVSKIALFASKYTMESNYIPSYLKQLDIEIIIPAETDRFQIDSLRKKLYNNQETDEDIKAYVNLINLYSEHSHVLIACTELSILNSHIQHKKIIDMAFLQIHAAIKQTSNIN